MRTFTSVIPFEPQHAALVEVQDQQQGEADRFGQKVGDAAKLGPAFSAVETDETGRIHRVLACLGLAETKPLSDPGGGYATAWGIFAKDLRASQFSAITAAIRGVLDNCGYDKVDMLVSASFPGAQRYAAALGFTVDTLIYARSKA